MSVKLSSLAVDINAEQSGDWVDIPDLPGVALKVRSINAPAYQVARGLLMQKLRRKHGQDKPIPVNDLTVALGALYAEHLLLDWRGLADDNDQPLPFSTELSTSLLTNPEYRNLVQHVAYAAGRVGERDVEFTDDLIKN